MTQGVVAFLCSTYADLRDERASVLDALVRLRVQHDSMEFFGARNEVPLEVCLEQVRESNVVIVVVAHMYGSLIPDWPISYVEAEYNEAVRLGKPCLVYLLANDVPVLPSNVERDPVKMAKLESFKHTLMARHTVAGFRDKHDLALRVAADLGRVLDSLARSGEQAKLSTNEGDLLNRALEVLKDAITQGISPEDLLGATQRAVFTLLSATGHRKIRVFLSHSHTDNDQVRRFAATLRQLGVEPWFDEDRIQMGDSIVEAIGEGLNSSDCVAVFLSQAYVESKWSMKELDAAMARRLSQPTTAKIVPILLGDAEVPPLLRDVRYLDMRDGNAEAAARSLVESLRGPPRQVLAEQDARINIKDIFSSGLPGEPMPVIRKF